MKPQRIVVALAAVALLVAGCGGRSEGGGREEASGGTRASSVSGDFGDLTGVCGPGDAKSATAQGVTDESISVGVFTDMGYTKDSGFEDAAKVFTSWCNAAGGINGRPIAFRMRDANLMEVRQRMVEACREDFALVGGGAALDGLGVKERLNCLLPSFPAQVTQAQAVGADLEISASPSRAPGYDPNFGFRTWLLKEAYPDSAGAVGLINGDSPVTKVLGAGAQEALEAAGATIVYNDLYPLAGVTDWTPYAQAIKDKGVKGLVFFGDFRQLPKLESVLTSMDYKLDWIDSNNNSYNPAFIELLGKSAGFQNNVVDLGGSAALSSIDEVPALQQVQQMYDDYAPGAEITFPALRAMSSWLLFAKSASSCGDDLTRRCLYDAAQEQTDWTGGGLHAANNIASPIPPQPCFNVERATPDGWVAADFNPDNGLFRCNIEPYKYQTDYGSPMTLAAVGKSMNDF